MLAPPIAEAEAGTRVLYYSHDSYGLGHLRRTLALAHRVRERLPDAAQLIVSGAAHTDGWRLPAGADWVKLPSVVKTAAGEYRSRSLECAFATTHGLRQDLVLTAVRHFQPDVVVVDHVPGGLHGEALPALRHAAAMGSRLVLGLRDVIDDATLVQRDWRRAGNHALLDGLYDAVVVYGDRAVYDVVREYGLSPVAATKTTFVGYLRAPEPASREAIRARLGLGDERLVVVTAGGGGDGAMLVGAALDAFADGPPAGVRALVVAGPLMAPDERAELERRARRCGERVRLVDAVAELGDVLAVSDAVVSMGGYNTVREILSHRRPALIVPRVRPRLEQLVRAEALAARGLVRVLHPAELTAGRLRAEVDRLLREPPRPAAPPRLDGLDRFVDVLEDMTAAAPCEELLAPA
ncbi:MAG: glycosyltransferase [Thermoleophilia bacterium]